MNRPVHFEIHSSDPDRAIAFYQGVFGWQFSKWHGPVDYWNINTGDGPGINGGLVRRMGPPPVPGQAVNAHPISIKVASCDDSVSSITQHGGTIALPKMAIPKIGWLAYGIDPDGNIFGVMQDDTSAG